MAESKFPLHICWKRREEKKRNEMELCNDWQGVATVRNEEFKFCLLTKKMCLFPVIFPKFSFHICFSIPGILLLSLLGPEHSWYGRSCWHKGILDCVFLCLFFIYKALYSEIFKHIRGFFVDFKLQNAGPVFCCVAWIYFSLCLFLLQIRSLLL